MVEIWWRYGGDMGQYSGATSQHRRGIAEGSWSDNAKNQHFMYSLNRFPLPLKTKLLCVVKEITEEIIQASARET